MNEKRTQFFNELYTGELAEMKATSVRLPAGLIDDINEKAAELGRSQSNILAECILKGFSLMKAQQRGDLIMTVYNPQTIREPNEETRAEILAILADIAKLKIDQRAGYNTGINKLINYHYEKLCKENNGKQYESEE